MRHFHKCGNCNFRREADEDSKPEMKCPQCGYVAILFYTPSPKLEHCEDCLGAFEPTELMPFVSSDNELLICPYCHEDRESVSAK